MTRSELKTVAVAVGVVILLAQLDATRGLVSGGNRYFR